MSDSHRQGDIVLISIAVLVLFIVANLLADPADGAVLGRAELAVATADPDPGADLTSMRGSDHEVLETAGELAVGTGRSGWEFVARPIGGVKGFTTGGGSPGGFFNSCFIDFNDSVVLSSLPDHAIDSVVEWPFWNQYCPQFSDTAVSVEPVGSSHYHLGYVDETIRWCLDLETFGRPVDPDDAASDCDPIDPLTEPRSGVQPHVENYSIRVFAYDTQTKDRVKLDLNQIRILSGQAEVCFVKTDLPWITAEPTDDPPGYCGDLGPGNWDVSESVIDAHEVRIYARSSNMSFTDLRIDTQ